MFYRLWLPAVLSFVLYGQSTAPSYSASDLVNGATYLPGPIAPNTWVTLYGKNLAWVTASAGPSDMVAGQWPVKIAGAGVQIQFSGGTPARLSYVSPTQINFLTPAFRISGPATLTLVRDGMVGPAITVTFADVSPGLFQNNSMASASHADGSPINNDAPAHPGEIVVLYGTGFGPPVIPLDDQSDGRLVTSTDPNAIRLQRIADLRVMLDDTVLDPEAILWAGLTPGCAGVYQVNLQLPDSAGPNPAVRVWIGDQGSAPDVRLPLQP
jgi:uncharacterized protein (TIGR03437 family)